jgi:hypothetical protein
MLSSNLQRTLLECPLRKSELKLIWQGWGVIFYTYESLQKNSVRKSAAEYKNKVNDRAIFELQIIDARARVIPPLLAPLLGRGLMN